MRQLKIMMMMMMMMMMMIMKEELIRIWQLKTSYIIQLVLSTMCIVPNKLHESLKLRNLCPGLHILMQKAVILKYMPYRQKVFGSTVSKGCLVSETCTLFTAN
jgi:hypothetical protein